MRFLLKMWVKEVLPSPVSAILLFYKAMNTSTYHRFSVKNSSIPILVHTFHFMFYSINRLLE